MNTYKLSILTAILLFLTVGFCQASEIPGLDKVIKDVPTSEVDAQLADYVSKLKLVPVPVPQIKDANEEQRAKIHGINVFNSMLQGYNEDAKNCRNLANLDFNAWNRGTLATLGRNYEFTHGYKCAYGSLPPFKYVDKK